MSAKSNPRLPSKGAATSQSHRPRGFVDYTRLYVRSGSGGMGGASYGGIGGDGGSIIIKATRCSMPMMKRVQAENGGNSSRKGGTRGAPGKDIYIAIPVGTVVRVEQEEVGASRKQVDVQKVALGGTDSMHSVGQKEKLPIVEPAVDASYDLDTEGQTLVVAPGGRGGSVQTKDYNPERGVRRVLRLELKSIADVGLVGFPNAGKSTLLNLVSQAKPAIGSYPFTTLRPQIGVVNFDERDSNVGEAAEGRTASLAPKKLPCAPIKVADIPGIIEGASKNIGMGHKFLRHVERTTGLVYVIDVNGFSLNVDDSHRTAITCFEQLLNELAQYSNGMLLTRPSLVVVNKIDTLKLICRTTGENMHGSPHERGIVDVLSEMQQKDKEWLETLYDEIRTISEHAGVLLHDIVPLSAQKGIGVERLRKGLQAICENRVGGEVDWDV
eukprot:CFRG5680T1